MHNTELPVALKAEQFSGGEGRDKTCLRVTPLQNSACWMSLLP